MFLHGLQIFNIGETCLKLMLSPLDRTDITNTFNGGSGMRN